VGRIAGIDEAGRGPLAGPVVAAAVLFNEGYSCKEITDSKKLSAKKREDLIGRIDRDSLDWTLVAVGPRTIDQLNIRGATHFAMSIAASKLKPDLFLIDGNMEIKTLLPQKTVIKGDQLHVEISAASILAKVWRDKIMGELDELFPQYGFAKHAGYPTASHLACLSRFGPSPVHRRSFAPVRRCLANSQEVQNQESLPEVLLIHKKSSQTQIDWLTCRRACYPLSNQERPSNYQQELAI